MYRRLLAALLLGASLAPVAAQAAPTEAELNAARKLFDDAQAQEADGHWIEALELLQRIVLVKETAGIRFHMATCEEHLGQLLAAEADYRRAAELAPAMTGNDGPVIAQRTEKALGRLKPRIPLLTLKAPADLPGLGVEIGGKPIPLARLGRPLPFDPGDIIVKATAPGRRPFSRKLALNEGDTPTLDLVLPLADDAGPSPGPSSSSPAPAPPSAAPRRWPAYVVGGAGLAAAGLGVGFYLRHRRLDDETTRVCNDPAVERCDPRRFTTLDDYKRYGLISGGAALVGLGVATYLWLSASPSRPETTLVVGPGAVGVAGRW